MPQVHNKSILLSNDTNAFSKTSRYMATVRVSEVSKRRIRAFNRVENRLTRHKLNFFDRHSEIEWRRRERETKKVVENLKKTLAYKLVLKTHNITHAQDYRKALDDDYSRDALRNDIKHMIAYMEPDKVRERKAKALIDENRKRYESILNRNRKTIEMLCPRQVKSWRYYDSGHKTVDSDDEEEENDDDEKEEIPRKSVFPSITRHQHAIALPSILQPPSKPTLPLNRHGITKSFLLESGRGSMDKVSLNPHNSKPDCELLPLQFQKKLMQI